MTESPAARWRPTAALGRALVVAATAVCAALLVLAVPFVALATLGLLHRPERRPTLEARIDQGWLAEGQGTTSRLAVAGADDAEYLTRASARPPYVALRPQHGQVGAFLDGPD